MQEKLIARPTFNRKTSKWNIAINTEEGEIKLGHKIDKDSIFFEYLAFDSKKNAIEYIKKENRLSLKK